jgi:hypothetical protein
MFKMAFIFDRFIQNCTWKSDCLVCKEGIQNTFTYSLLKDEWSSYLLFNTWIYFIGVEISVLLVFEELLFETRTQS